MGSSPEGWSRRDVQLRRNIGFFPNTYRGGFRELALGSSSDRAATEKARVCATVGFASAPHADGTEFHPNPIKEPLFGRAAEMRLSGLAFG